MITKLLKPLLFTSTILFAFACGVLFFLFQRDWVDFSVLENDQIAKPSILLDDEGNEIGRFELDRREPISYEKIPKILVNAFMAAEDHNFFDHCGISVRGIFRSMVKNIVMRKVVQGASTITQQVARSMFLSREKRWWRKVQEIFLAFQLERSLTKERIFELYVNNIYFGRGIYGVEAACRRFWNKSVCEISLDEAATLAAVAKSAYLYSPLNALENAQSRRNVILGTMLRRLHFISQKEYERARSKELAVKDNLIGSDIRLYIQERIRQWAERRWGKDVLYQDGLKIQTTINSEKQAIAERFFSKKVEELRGQVGSQLNGGVISIEPSNGKIKVCIGGYNFHESQFNRAFQAVRQMGSSFKPIVYTAAMIDGIEMDTVVVDEPIEMKLPGCTDVWRPKNWTRKFEGPMTLARALSFSNNIITIKTLLKTGIEKVVKLAKEFGLTRPIPAYPSIALGTAEATVKESVAMFNVFANNGVYVEPYLVDWVKDSFGKKLWEHKPIRKKVLDSKINSKMVNTLALRWNKMKERAGRNDWVKAEMIGKTGSTNEAATTWYVGATPELTTSVYIGRDDNKPLGRYVFGSQTAFPVWLQFYKKLSFVNKQFYVDPELEEVCIDWVTGSRLLAKSGKNKVVVLH